MEPFTQTVLLYFFWFIAVLITAYQADKAIKKEIEKEKNEQNNVNK